MELSTGLNTASSKLPGSEQEFIQAAVLIFTTLLQGKSEMQMNSHPYSRYRQRVPRLHAW